MKSIFLTVTVLATLQHSAGMASEGLLCSPYFTNVTRKVELIKAYGQDLSQMAKDKLIKDLKFETEQCIAECEGEKFKFCDDSAKWIPQAELSLKSKK